MNSAVPLTHDLVLIGGGHTHALFLRRWGMGPVAGVRVTLIDPNVSAAYSGMLPGFVAGHYTRSDLDIDLVRLVGFAGGRLILGSAEHVDLQERTVRVTGRPPVRFDTLSVDIGITSGMDALPGFAAHAVPAKPLGAFARRWQDWLGLAASGDLAPEVAVIGGGVAGCELAMAMAFALRTNGVQGARVCVVEAGQLASGVGARARAKLQGAMAEQGVASVLNVPVASVSDQGVTLADGNAVSATLVVGAAGARPYPWLKDSGLALEDGFIRVDRSLRAENHPSVFAVGDCAHLAFDPRPKAGVFAVRQAPVLYHNIRADLLHEQRRHYAPQRDYLKLISLGAQTALADKSGLTLAGPALWRLKDRIDRRFMDQFSDLSPMRKPAVRPKDAVPAQDRRLPLCTGCGAKVGQEDLQAGTAGFTGAARQDVLHLPGDDAAALRIGTSLQVISVDHLRALTGDPFMHGKIAAVHALGDIWAMGAAPQMALASLVLPEMEAAMQRATLRDIMAGADEVFQSAGAAIGGGHTTLGAEMTVGFTVTGVSSDDPIGLSGAEAGDLILLTKPIGSGTILAGEMAGLARGQDVADALAAMAHDQGDAARILRRAKAMTDVTGFGLAGHMMNILRASGRGARIAAADIPLLNGARALADKGVRSSLYAANLQAAPVQGPDGPVRTLMHDPQTAGGLLAALPVKAAQAALRDLLQAGYAAAIIGEITPGPPRIELV
ncbi:MAG: selenide, water dikinase SelD [Pseudomonadota bacterium]